MDLVFIDTSALYAYFDQSDSNHSLASLQIQKIQMSFVTTNHIIDETITLLARNLGTRIAYKIGTDLLNEHLAKIVRVSLDDENVIAKE